MSLYLSVRASIRMALYFLPAFTDLRWSLTIFSALRMATCLLLWSLLSFGLKSSEIVSTLWLCVVGSGFFSNSARIRSIGSISMEDSSSWGTEPVSICALKGSRSRPRAVLDSVWHDSRD